MNPPLFQTPLGSALSALLRRPEEWHSAAFSIAHILSGTQVWLGFSGDKVGMRCKLISGGNLGFWESFRLAREVRAMLRARAANAAREGATPDEIAAEAFLRIRSGMTPTLPLSERLRIARQIRGDGGKERKG